MKSNDELFQLLMDRISRLDYIHPEDIPDIDLYMDQVTTFMERELADCKRYPDDKILTKTMINNYAKNDLLPPPEKKKYSREHMLMLIFIYYYKSLLSINDIQTLMKPLTEHYFNADSGIRLADIYEELFSLEATQRRLVQEDAQRIYDAASQTFPETEGDERQLLQRFAFISLLSFDVYIKKQMVETLVDGMAAEQQSEERKGKAAKHSKKDSETR